MQKHFPQLGFAEGSPEARLVEEFFDRQNRKEELATDQLLNAVFLLVKHIPPSQAPYSGEDKSKMAGDKILDLVLKRLTTSSQAI